MLQHGTGLKWTPVTGEGKLGHQKKCSIISKSGEGQSADDASWAPSHIDIHVTQSSSINAGSQAGCPPSPLMFAIFIPGYLYSWYKVFLVAFRDLIEYLSTGSRLTVFALTALYVFANM